MPEFTFIDLFSGAGGFTEGVLLAGNPKKKFRLVAASDIHYLAKYTHENRFRQQLGLDYSFLVEDIRDKYFLDNLLKCIYNISGKYHVDLIVGGPPCQGFSLFGKRDRKDPRNDLFLPYLKVIEKIRPKYFVMENVPGLAMMYEGEIVNLIYKEVSSMKRVKYNIVGPIKVNATDFGVPQARERIIFIGNRKDMTPIEEIDKTHFNKPITVREAIGDLEFLRPWENNGSYDSDYPPVTDYQIDSRNGRLFTKLGISRKDNILKNHDAACHTPIVMARFALIEQGKGLDSIPKLAWNQHLRSSKKWCVKLNPDLPSFTVVTLPDDLVHYTQPRILTVREMARLQSFDDTFEFLGPRATGGGGKGNKKRNLELPQYSQVGNAVPPLLAKAIAENLLRALQK